VEIIFEQMAESLAGGGKPKAHRTKNEYRLKAKGCHLTYKHFIPLNELHDKIVALYGELKWFSGCHELGHGTETPYPHTHFAFEAVKAKEVNGAKCFDILYKPPPVLFVPEPELDSDDEDARAPSGPRALMPPEGEEELVHPNIQKWESTLIVTESLVYFC